MYVKRRGGGGSGGGLFSEFYGFQISPVFRILMDTMFAT